MPLIRTVNVKDAVGMVEQEHLRFLQLRGEVPRFFNLFSSSPELMRIQGRLEGHYLNHPRLGFLLVCYIRMLAAHAIGFESCADFFARLLKTAGGVLDRWVQAPLKDPMQAPLPDREKALLIFCLKALKSPESIKAADVDALKAQDWTDACVLEAVHLALMVKTHHMLSQAFHADAPGSGPHHPTESGSLPKAK